MEKRGVSNGEFDNLGHDFGANPGAAPISMQPVASAGGFAGCPPGLEYLTQVDQLIVKQQLEMIEIFTGFERKNRYRIMNSVGQQVFFAQEESGCCERQYCGPKRGFNIHITDNANQEVLRISKELTCCVCCWCADSDGCAMYVNVETPVGTPVGYVRMEKYCCDPILTIRTMDHRVVGTIRGPCWTCACCKDVTFDIYSGESSDTVIGKIAKRWTGAAVELFTDADTFCVSFPMDMDVRTKALFVGALFLVDFMFFETKN